MEWDTGLWWYGKYQILEMVVAIFVYITASLSAGASLPK